MSALILRPDEALAHATALAERLHTLAEKMTVPELPAFKQQLAGIAQVLEGAEERVKERLRAEVLAKGEKTTEASRTATFGRHVVRVTETGAKWNAGKLEALLRKRGYAPEKFMKVTLGVDDAVVEKLKRDGVLSADDLSLIRNERTLALKVEET